jgi:hypothetical protein
VSLAKAVSIPDMTDTQRLLVVRAIHTAIYVLMAVSTFVLLYAGITGAHGPRLSVALGLLGIEVVGTVMAAGLLLLGARWLGVLQ